MRAPLVSDAWPAPAALTGVPSESDSRPVNIKLVL